jgi:hypothetical protein
MESSKINNNIYKNGKIYKIVDIGYNEQYFGSTTVELSTRMSRHRSNYKRYEKGDKYYCTSFILFGKYDLDNCKIELVEMYPCSSKEELRKREGYWIKQEDCVNKRIAGRTLKEHLEVYRPKYYKENCEMIKEKVRKYHLENKEKIKAYNDEPLKCPTCEKLISRRNMLRHQKTLHPISEDHRIYAAKEAEAARQRNQIYRENNRELIRQKDKEKQQCPYCDKVMCKSGLRIHIKNKHTCDANK